MLLLTNYSTFIKIANILNLNETSPINTNSLINLKDIDISSISGAENISSNIITLDISISGKYLLLGGYNETFYTVYTIFQLKESSNKNKKKISYFFFFSLNFTW
jgi:hypothetical protein